MNKFSKEDIYKYKKNSKYCPHCKMYGKVRFIKETITRVNTKIKKFYTCSLCNNSFYELYNLSTIKPTTLWESKGVDFYESC